MAQETIIRPAPDVETIARQLIAEYHPELTEACILYLFTSAAAACTPQKCNPKLRYLASLHVPRIVKAEVASRPDVIVWINEMEWELLVTGQHRPFVDHRLTHIGVEHTSEGTPRFVLVPHPIEEHPEVIQRFGAWNATIKQVRDLLQPELDFTPTAAEPENRYRSKGGCMRKRRVTTFRDMRFERQLSLERGEQIKRFKAAGQLRTTEDFSPAELAVLQAKVAGYIAGGRCRVTCAGDAPLETW